MQRRIKELGLDLAGAEFFRSREYPRLSEYVNSLYEMRKRKGMTVATAQHTLCFDYDVFGMMMVEMGDASGFDFRSDTTVSGNNCPACNYRQAVRCEQNCGHVYDDL